MLRLPSTAALLTGALLIAPAARAADPPSPPAAAPAPVYRPNVRAALAVGALTMLVPGVIGGFRTAYGASDGDKTAGLLLASGGFTLAPVFSHLVTHEWRRAALFGVIPLGTTIAAAAFVSQVPGAVYHGNMGTRTAFGVLLGVGMLDAVLGLADTAAAGDRAEERARPRTQSFFVLPSVGREGATVSIGGFL